MQIANKYTLQKTSRACLVLFVKIHRQKRENSVNTNDSDDDLILTEANPNVEDNKRQKSEFR
ncbi:hypothetical protein T11_11987 [Trichinella zimbabwensis]|uniref:Uncharacterized protein n=2 Tax=Trichinella TaxID=6333 RepID=A0A0V1MDN4_9BILA|nr:hypothetical protein T11_11987 [Trichinella zimbabwensis]KRZ69911.1 hypothetical protein T10_8770 [Trichinella papuae]